MDEINGCKTAKTLQNGLTPDKSDNGGNDIK